MHFMIQYLKKYKLLFCINAIAVFGFALVELGIPTIVAMMIDQGVAYNNRQYIYQMGMLMIFISVLGVCGTIVVGYCSAKISTNITCDIRNDLFRKIQTFTAYEFNHFHVSSLITRTANDAYQIQMFINVLLRTAILTPLMFVASFFMTIQASIPLSLVILLTIPMIIVGVIYVARKSKPLSMHQQESLDELNCIAKENLSGIRVIRSFCNDTYEQQRFMGVNHKFTLYSKKLFKLLALTSPIFFLLMNLAVLAIFTVASFLIEQHALQVGQLVAFMDYLFHAMFSVMLFCVVFMQYPRAEVSAKRIQEVLDWEAMIQNPKAIQQGNDEPCLEFDHVTFVYPNGEEAVLKDISFSAKANETIAFIGSTGSGKSTLVNLIPRFYDVSEGHIYLNGVDVRDYDLADLRARLGVIPQKAVLFKGSIAQNLRFANPNASDEQLLEALAIAQGLAFVQAKEAGLDSEISEGASNLSGGQKQRLSIARALLSNAQVYIFDDAFSALDYKTDAVLRKSIHQQLHNCIKIFVAQRISSIMDCDQIIVLDEGKMVGKGRHHELLKNCEIYREIALSQFSEEELFNETK